MWRRGKKMPAERGQKMPDRSTMAMWCLSRMPLLHMQNYLSFGCTSTIQFRWHHAKLRQQSCCRERSSYPSCGLGGGGPAEQQLGHRSERPPPSAAVAVLQSAGAAPSNMMLGRDAKKTIRAVHAPSSPSCVAISLPQRVRDKDRMFLIVVNLACTNRSNTVLLFE
jgi:hypothetical protein